MAARFSQCVPVVGSQKALPVKDFMKQTEQESSLVSLHNNHQIQSESRTKIFIYTIHRDTKSKIHETSVEHKPWLHVQQVPFAFSPPQLGRPSEPVLLSYINSASFQRIQPIFTEYKLSIRAVSTGNGKLNGQH